MPKILGNERTLEKDFEALSNATNRFSKIKPELVAKNPKCIRIFRFALGFSLGQMAKLLGKKAATVSHYELGKIKSIPTQEAVRIASLLQENLPHDLLCENVLVNFRKFSEMSHGGAVMGFQRAESAVSTAQEKKIESVLSEAGAKYECHKTLETAIGQLNFDFLVNENTVIECSAATNKIKAESLDFRIIQLKKRNPKIYSIAVVPRKVNRGFLRRLADFDKIVFDDELKKLELILAAPQAAVQLDSTPGNSPRKTAG